MFPTLWKYSINMHKQGKIYKNIHYSVWVYLTLSKSIEFVLEYLADANFDPEFYKLHESEIVAKFNLENNTNIQIKKKSWKRIFSKS